MERSGTLSRQKVTFAVILILAGAAGLLASFSLTVDALAIAKDPSAALSCNVNASVQCARNIGSWQGKVFGFPNPILGLMCFPAPVIVGVALLAGARFKAWFWWIFAAGMTFAAGFVFWLAFQSIFDLGTLCPWCALTYVAVIPSWVATLTALLRNGSAGPGGVKLAEKLGTFVPVLVAVMGLVLIFGLAQLELGIIQSLFA